MNIGTTSAELSDESSFVQIGVFLHEEVKGMSAVSS
jgi:hypothetical protein